MLWQAIRVNGKANSAIFNMLVVPILCREEILRFLDSAVELYPIVA
jgi:hypothetical protein